jgi:sugar phosphate isomerase/epimerase
MKLKSLIVGVIIIFISLLIFTLLNSFTGPADKKFIGLQLYSIRDSIRKDVKGAINKVGDMGYRFVEPAGYANGRFYDRSPAEFKAMCRKKKMIVLSSHTGQNAPNDANREKTMAWWDTCIAAHKAAGAKFIVQPSMGGDAYKSLERLKEYCDYFNAVGAKCNAAGLRFGYHNHDKEFSTKLDGEVIYDFMLKNTDPAKVMFEIDLYWAVVGGADPVDYFSKYPGRFELWHIKDKKEIGESGMMDFKKIWANAAKSGMKYGVVEVEQYNFDEFTSCKKSLDFLNSAGYVIMPLKSWKSDK